MTYELYIGDRTFSSWSMRGWLMLEAAGLDFTTHMVGLYSGTMAQDLTPLAPARTVPVLRTATGAILTDSIAMAETLVEAHPDLPLLPADPGARALARSMIAEMHSGFGALRAACPMNLSNVWAGYTASDGVHADIHRVEMLWTMARERFGGRGPWLFGDYTIADAFYAPVACRMTTYGLPVSALSQAYIDAHLADPALRRWRAMGQTVSYDPFPYPLDLPRQDWPIPGQIAAEAMESGDAENKFCPYSGKPISHLAKIDGRVFGFCNAFCRDKTVADPGAWPAFMDLLAR